MNGRPIGAFLLVLVMAAPLAAQEQEAQEPETREQATTREGETAIPEVLRAIQLPNAAEILRERGVPVEEIEAAIEGARQQDLPPAEMTGMLEETAGTVEETGPIENFGAFVQARLADGLRGRELAEAIRAEHARRGIGQGRMLESRGRGQGMRGGPPGRSGPRDTMGPDSMHPDSGRRGPPMERGQRGQRPDSVPARGGGQGQGGQGQGGSQGQGGGQQTGGQR